MKWNKMNFEWHSRSNVYMNVVCIVGSEKILFLSHHVSISNELQLEMHLKHIYNENGQQTLENQWESYHLRR